MTADACNAPRLVADIGGTNTRVALFAPQSGRLEALANYTNRDYAEPGDVIEDWLGTLQSPGPEVCCIAVAAPDSGDRVEMVNMDWSFSRSELVQRFGFKAARWLNDFEANAYSLPHLAEADRYLIHAGKSDGDKLATIGPGTGLGGATLEWLPGGHAARACEPGHTGLSPASETELELFRYLHHQHGEVYTELLVSGPGLTRIHGALAAIQGQGLEEELLPSEVTRRALSGEDGLARQALEIFCALLGSACGDFVLANGAYGGLYLAGGIVPRIRDFLLASDFHHRFTAKGPMEPKLSTIPVFAITHPQPGLLGAAHAPL